jgi:hypothetical protein
VANVEVAVGVRQATGHHRGSVGRERLVAHTLYPPHGWRA